MMTLDEAIKHAEEVAEEQNKMAKEWHENQKCENCAKEHRQLAEWLKDYKRLSEQASKRGEWIMHVNYLHPEESEQECSVCHGLQPISITDDDYCPRCGAKMVEPQENEGEE